MQVLELRERRLDHEETLGEVQKATDEHKRNLDRQVRASCREECAGLVFPSCDPNTLMPMSRHFYAIAPAVLVTVWP